MSDVQNPHEQTAKPPTPPSSSDEEGLLKKLANPFVDLHDDEFEDVEWLPGIDEPRRKLLHLLLLQQWDLKSLPEQDDYSIKLEAVEKQIGYAREINMLLAKGSWSTEYDEKIGKQKQVDEKTIEQLTAKSDALAIVRSETEQEELETRMSLMFAEAVIKRESDLERNFGRVKRVEDICVGPMTSSTINELRLLITRNKYNGGRDLMMVMIQNLFTWSEGKRIPHWDKLDWDKQLDLSRQAVYCREKFIGDIFGGIEMLRAIKDICAGTMASSAIKELCEALYLTRGTGCCDLMIDIITALPENSKQTDDIVIPEEGFLKAVVALVASKEEHVRECAVGVLSFTVSYLHRQPDNNETDEERRIRVNKMELAFKIVLNSHLFTDLTAIVTDAAVIEAHKAGTKGMYSSISFLAGVILMVNVLYHRCHFEYSDLMCGIFFRPLRGCTERAMRPSGLHMAILQILVENSSSSTYTREDKDLLFSCIKFFCTMVDEVIDPKWYRTKYKLEKKFEAYEDVVYGARRNTPAGVGLVDALFNLIPQSFTEGGEGHGKIYLPSGEDIKSKGMWKQVILLLSGLLNHMWNDEEESSFNRMKWMSDEFSNARKEMLKIRALLLEVDKDHYMKIQAADAADKDSSPSFSPLQRLFGYVVNSVQTQDPTDEEASQRTKNGYIIAHCLCSIFELSSFFFLPGRDAALARIEAYITDSGTSYEKVEALVSASCVGGDATPFLARTALTTLIAFSTPSRNKKQDLPLFRNLLLNVDVVGRVAAALARDEVTKRTQEQFYVGCKLLTCFAVAPEPEAMGGVGNTGKLINPAYSGVLAILKEKDRDGDDKGEGQESGTSVVERPVFDLLEKLAKGHEHREFEQGQKPDINVYRLYMDEARDALRALALYHKKRVLAADGIDERIRAAIGDKYPTTMDHAKKGATESWLKVFG